MVSSSANASAQAPNESRMWLLYVDNASKFTMQIALSLPT
jgi:hypothetical protein